MRDIYPKKPELPKKRRAENKKPLKKGRSSLFRKAPATPDMRTKLFFKTKSQPQLFSFRTIISAFIIALLIVLGYLFRDELKDKLKIIRQIAGEKIKKLNLISELPPAEIKVEQPKEKITPLVYFAVQTNEKVDIKWAGKALNNEQTETKTQTSIREQGKTIYSFISNTSIYDGTISISNNYLAYLNAEGLNLYSMTQKQTDLVVASTEISKPRKVIISPQEDFLAFSVIKDNETRLYFYSLKQRGSLEENFRADDFVFGPKNKVFFSSGKELWVFSLTEKKAKKITTLERAILKLLKVGELLILVSGQEKAVSLWLINDSQETATHLASFQLTFDFKASEFGSAKKEDNLYLSFAGEIIALNLKTKEKKEFSFSQEVYCLLNYLEDQDYFVAFKKPQALEETSLIIFSDKQIIYESAIEPKILFLK